MCIEHQQLQRWVRLSTLPTARGSDTTHWLSDKSYRHRLPPPLNAQSDTRWQPQLWPTESSQRSTPVPKDSLGEEEKQQWCHVLCTTDVWTCRGPPVQALCNRWFELSLSPNDHNNCDRHNSCIVSTHTQNPLHLDRLAIMRRPAFILMLRTTNSVHAL